MLSRIFWVGAAGIALVAGMMLQDGDWIFGSDDRAIDARIDRTVDRAVDRTVDRTVDRAVDSSIDQQVIGPDGRVINAPPETERALAEAVGALIKAEANLAALRVGEGTAQEIRAATTARDHARTNVDRLKTDIQRHNQAPRLERDALREQIRREVREDVRDTVRDAVRN